MGFGEISTKTNYIPIIQGDTVNLNFNLRYDNEPVTDVVWAKFSSADISAVIELENIGEGLFNLFIASATTDNYTVGKYHYDVTVKFTNTSIDIVTFIHNGVLEIKEKNNEV